ncbi:MAG: DUF1320 domain-containing protein [Candidatus Methylomirabilis sp.]|nr:DUF1320 domain-containing protein [Deltaproteobacteria bacterium]
MLYASVQDLKDWADESQLVQLTDPEGAVVVDAVVEKALEAASARIDGYLEGRYALPLAKVPAALKGHCCDLALYILWGKRPLGDSDDIRKRHEDAVRYLERVAEGRIGLGLDADGGAPAAAAPMVEGPAKVFGRDNLESY